MTKNFNEPEAPQEDGPFSEELSPIFNRLLAADNDVAAFNCVREAGALWGFDGLMIGGRLWDETSPRLSSWDVAFQDRHFSPHGLPLNPAAQRATFRQSGFWWNWPEPWRNAEDKSLLADARTVGIQSAYSLPLFDAFGLVAIFHFSSPHPNSGILHSHTGPLTHFARLFLFLCQGKEAVRTDHSEKTGGDDQSPISPLSPREIDVLSWVARGASNERIAEYLGISHNAVEFHLGNIFDKLEVANRTAAVVKAMRSQLLFPH